LPITNVTANVNLESVLLPEGFDDYLDLSRAVIVELDMHGGHLDPEADCPAPNARGRVLIDPINQFNAKCRELGVPVIHIVNTYRMGDFEGVDSAWRRITEGHRSMLPPEVKGPDCPFCNLALEGTKWSQLVVECKENDYVVDTKKRITAFETTDLDFLLKQLDKDIVVITGIMSDCCDLCSAYYAGSKDYKVIYLPDLTRGSSPQNEEASKLLISRYIGLVIDSEVIVEEWTQQRNRSKKN